MLPLAAIGILVILIGLSVCTQRIDNYWRDKQRIQPMTSPTIEIPPFIYSPTQCIDCGKECFDSELGKFIDLLNLEKRCQVCHGAHYTKKARSHG